MGGDNSCGQDSSYMNSLDVDNFLIDNFEPSFSFENVIANSTMQCSNNNNSVVDSSLSYEEATYDDNMLNSFNSNISEDATLPKFTTTTSTGPSQTTYILSFENSSVEPATTHSEIPKGKQGSKNIRHRSSCEMQGHIMAERKRRQVLTERFIALSAIIPGLKKVSFLSFIDLIQPIR